MWALRKSIVVPFIIGLFAVSATALAAGGGPSQGLDRAAQAQERHTDALLAKSGVVGTTVGLNPAGKAVVKVFTALSGVKGIPQNLDGVPVAVQVTGEFLAFADPKSKFDKPVPIGVSSSNENSVRTPYCFTGTLGARLTNNSDVFALSNNHVYANENGFNGAGINSRLLHSRASRTTAV